jgi:hypothetical protein
MLCAFFRILQLKYQRVDVLISHKYRKLTINRSTLVEGRELWAREKVSLECRGYRK